MQWGVLKWHCVFFNLLLQLYQYSITFSILLPQYSNQSVETVNFPLTLLVPGIWLKDNKSED